MFIVNIDFDAKESEVRELLSQVSLILFPSAKHSTAEYITSDYCQSQGGKPIMEDALLSLKQRYISCPE